jgi:hypothetical protein
VEILLYALGPLVVGWIIWAVIQAAAAAPGNELAKKFAGMGNLIGKTRQEIEAVVGPPQSFSATGDGEFLLQWMANTYHICLIFDAEGRCQGITSEVNVA